MDRQRSIRYTLAFRLAAVAFRGRYWEVRLRCRIRFWIPCTASSGLGDNRCDCHRVTALATAMVALAVPHFDRATSEWTRRCTLGTLDTRRVHFSRRCDRPDWRIPGIGTVDSQLERSPLPGRRGAARLTCAASGIDRAQSRL